MGAAAFSFRTGRSVPGKVADWRSGGGECPMARVSGFGRGDWAGAERGGPWPWLALVPLLLFLLGSWLFCASDLVASIRLRIAVPSKGAPMSSSEVLVLRGGRAPGGRERGCCASARRCRGRACDSDGTEESAADSPPGRMDEEVGDRDAGERAGDEGAAGKRGEESDAREAGALLARGALGARLKLLELRLLPRDWVSTRPSTVALRMELA